MRGARWATYLWPGLPDLWWRGSWSGLALSFAFALLASFVVSATWVWDELLGPDQEGKVWLGFGAGWLALLFVSFRTARRGDTPPTGPRDLFPGAMAEYLKGNWLAAELIARELVVGCPGDVEAALLLVAVLRHTGRIDEAREVLDELTLWDRASNWQHEIETEYRRLSEKEVELAEASEQSGTVGQPPNGGGNQTEHKVQESNDTTTSLPDWRQAA